MMMLGMGKNYSFYRVDMMKMKYIVNNGKTCVIR